MNLETAYKQATARISVLEAMLKKCERELPVPGQLSINIGKLESLRVEIKTTLEDDENS